MLFFALSLSLSLYALVHQRALSRFFFVFSKTKKTSFVWRVVGGVVGGGAAASCVLGEQKRKEKEGREKKS